VWSKALLRDQPRSNGLLGWTIYQLLVSHIIGTVGTLYLLLKATALPRKSSGQNGGELAKTAMRGFKVKYNSSADFYRELKSRVDDYFKVTGRSTRDVPQMYLKSVIISLWLSLSYLLLVFVASTWWQGVLLAISLGLAMAGIGFNVQHDGGHRAYSNRNYVNHLAAMMLDLLGGSSYLWRWKHNLIHHNFPNITGADEDIDLVPLAHLSPGQPLYAIHRFQHLYIWVFYCLLPIRWHFFGDFRNLIRGDIGGHGIVRPHGWNMIVLLSGKVLFLFLAFLLPAILHPLWVVLLFYGVASVVLGFTLSVVFQLGHCVEEASFANPLDGTNRIEKAWAAHQIEAAVDFARTNRLLTWYIGGLNFQIEHHLFPNICHFHYPAISSIVEPLCAEFGVRYFAHETLRNALASHFKFLHIDREALARGKSK
jgi:linoleoyl-CoA desaturase